MLKKQFILENKLLVYVALNVLPLSLNALVDRPIMETSVLSPVAVTTGNTENGGFASRRARATTEKI